MNNELASEAPMSEVDTLMALIREAIENGVGARSGVYGWMYKNHDEFARTISEVGVRWRAVADSFGAAGIMDGHGKPPSAENCRNTWFAVRTDRKARARKAAQPKKQGQSALFG